LTLFLLLCSSIPFIWGCRHYFRHGVALFNQLVCCGLGCIALGRLFSAVSIFVLGHIPYGFHVGMLSDLGAFLFFASASMGSMDSLLDDGSRAMMKYRLLALLAPLCIGALYLPIPPIPQEEISLATKLAVAVIFCAFGLSAYFTLKHLLIPDVQEGIFRSTRLFHVVVLLLCLLSALELTLSALGWDRTLLTLALGVCYVALIPALERGSKQWAV